MDDIKNSSSVNEVMKNFEKELAKLESERAKILADYVNFLEQKKLEIVRKSLKED